MGRGSECGDPKNGGEPGAEAGVCGVSVQPNCPSSSQPERLDPGGSAAAERACAPGPYYVRRGCLQDCPTFRSAGTSSPVPPSNSTNFHSAPVSWVGISSQG